MLAGIAAATRRRIAVSAKDLGYDVEAMLAFREEGGKTAKFDEAIKAAVKLCSIAAVAEFEWSFEYKLLHSGNKIKAMSSHDDSKGATKKLAWARIKAGCVLAIRALSVDYREHARRKIDNLVSSLGGDPAKGVDGVLIGQKVSNVLLGGKTTLLTGKGDQMKLVTAIAKNGVNGLTGPFIELADEGDLSWSDMGNWDNWTGYRYKVASATDLLEEGAADGASAASKKAEKAYTKFNSFTSHVATQILPRQLEIVEAGEYDRLTSYIADEKPVIGGQGRQNPENVELTDEQKVLGLIEYMDPPLKSKSAYAHFTSMESEAASAELEAAFLVQQDQEQNPNQNHQQRRQQDPSTASTFTFNNNPAKGYHKEAHLRRDRSKADVYYHTPSGARLRSMPDVVSYLDALKSNGRFKPEQIPEEDSFSFVSPKISELKLYPKLDYSALGEKLDELYECIGDEGRDKYETLAAEDMSRFQEEFAKYKMWRQVRDFKDKSTKLDDDDDDIHGDSRKSGRKRRKVTQGPVSYLTSKAMSVYDLTTKSIRDYPKSSIIPDIERHVFLSDLTGFSGKEQQKDSMSMFDGSNLSSIRNTLCSLLKEGRVKRVFANLHKTDHANFFLAVNGTKPESIEEMQLKLYEIALKRTEAVLRRLILHKLQVDAVDLSAACELQEMEPEEYFVVKEETWQEAGHGAIGKMLWRSDGLEALVTHIAREVEYTGGASDDKSTGVGGVGGGKIVTRRTMFRCKVTNAGDFYQPAPLPVIDAALTEEEVIAVTERSNAAAELDRKQWTLTEFQVMGYADAWKLKQEQNRNAAEIYKAGLATKSYVGRTLSFAEDVFVKKGSKVARAKDPVWFRGKCVAAGPSDNKLMILGNDCTEAFWGRYFPETKTFIREGDTEAYATAIEWMGDNKTYDAAIGLLDYMVSQKESYLFLEPVDYVFFAIPDYPLVIKEMMDLGTVRKKLSARKYHDIDGERVDLRGKFKRDVELIFNNAYRFNGIGSDVGILAKTCEKKWTKRFSAVVDRIDKLKGGKGDDSDNEDGHVIEDVEGGMVVPKMKVRRSRRKEGEGERRKRRSERRRKKRKKEHYTNNFLSFPLSLSPQVRSIGVENSMKVSEVASGLPVKYNADKFSVSDDFIIRRTNGAKPGSKCFVARADPDVTASDRIELESTREQRHREMALLYNKFVGAGGGKTKKPPAKARKPMNVTVRAGDEVNVIAELDHKERVEEEKWKQEVEKRALERSFQHDFPPWLGTISFANGELNWEIRKPHLMPAMRYILRGLIHSGHVFEVESINDSKVSTGGGVVCIANAYMPALPYSVLRKKFEPNKKKKVEEEEEEEEVEISEYEKARMERVARNNEKLKALGLM